MIDQNIDDGNLLHRISQKDKNALTTLYERYGERLSAYALRILKDQNTADDVMQDSLLTIWQNAKTFRGEGSVVAWLFSIVHNKAMKTFREMDNLALEEISTEPQSPAAGPNEMLIKNERKSLLSIGVRNLTIEHRTVLDLVFFHGMSLKEVSKICDIPVGTVKSRLSYAKNALKGELARTKVALEDLK